MPNRRTRERTSRKAKIEVSFSLGIFTGSTYTGFSPDLNDTSSVFLKTPNNNQISYSDESIDFEDTFSTVAPLRLY